MPRRQCRVPSGDRMQARYAPPGRTSISQEIVVKPCGPHHFAACAGSVHILKTSSRGASNTRVSTISHSRAAGAMSAISWLPRSGIGKVVLVSFRLRGPEFLQVFAEAIEALAPEAPVVFDPI